MIHFPVPEALTFDDVLLLPSRSDVVPALASTQTHLTRNIQLNIPIISAAMDTVTESHMAIAIAQQGGIGIIHRNLSIEQQANEVDKVKRSESGMIVDPVTMSPDAKVSDALEVMRKYKISGVPITKSGKLVGILTNRDLRFETRFDIPIAKVMTKENLITVPVGTTLEQAEDILHEHRVEKLLVVDENYNLKGLITVKDIQKKLKYPNAAKDSHGRLRVAAAIGATGDFLERAQELVKCKVDLVTIDSAHGHSTRVLEAINVIKSKLPEVELIAGNVATFDGACELARAGVDGIKVGIGPGSICNTPVVTGAGVPQITAIAETYRATKDAHIPIIADGGIKYSGDITKALAAGASAVMIGSLFAGTDESPGELILYQGRSFKSYRGMGSIGAMAQGSSERYFQRTEGDSSAAVSAGDGDSNHLAKLVPEGIEGRVPYRGSVAPTDDSIAWARDVIARQLRQLTRLVDDLLDVSRITRGKITLLLTPLELTSVVAQAVETSRPLIDSRGHQLAVHVSSDPVWIRGDAVRLGQVLSNLLNNAAKYTPDGGRIGLT